MYATPDDLITRFTAREISSLLEGGQAASSDARLIAACRDAAAIADSYLAQALVLPLSDIPAALIAATADIARYRLHKDQVKEGGEDGKTTLRLRYEDAIKWLEAVAKGEISIFSIQRQSTEPEAPLPMRKSPRIAVVSSPVVFDQRTLEKMDAVCKH